MSTKTIVKCDICGESLKDNSGYKIGRSDTDSYFLDMCNNCFEYLKNKNSRYNVLDLPLKFIFNSKEYLKGTIINALQRNSIVSLRQLVDTDKVVLRSLKGIGQANFNKLINFIDAIQK